MIQYSILGQEFSYSLVVATILKSKYVRHNTKLKKSIVMGLSNQSLHRRVGPSFHMW